MCLMPDTETGFALPWLGSWRVEKLGRLGSKKVKEIKAVKEFQSSSLPRQRRLVPGSWFRDIGFAAKRLATSFICYLRLASGVSVSRAKRKSLWPLRSLRLHII